ncbi:MAG: glutamine synthetase family protein [Burkholderiales bacterium]|jgi:glutamine synthetase|nr:glutamine synthetase family protein [Burkholderiales bacterium]MCE1175552.1 glutamine synthetase family protein [Burkholderiales bacterium]
MTFQKFTTFNEMERWLDENRVTEIECLVPDLTGVARGKILPRNKFSEEKGMRLPEAIFGSTVTGEYPESEMFDSIIAPTDNDMELRPDPTTVRLVPWAQDATAQVLHDCFKADGTLVQFAPRSVLRRVESLYAKEGWEPVVAPELEFYLVSKNTDPNQLLNPPIGRNGRREAGRQAYSIDAVNEFDPLFEDIYDYTEAMDLDVDTLIHEVGAGQMEINFLHGKPLDLADKVFFFKRTLREAAIRHDMFATFMAKPMQHEPGSAMHIHQSIVDAATGKNIFSKADGSQSEMFLHYIGGLQKYMPLAMALVAPYVNSYRRITRKASAPINVQWGRDNRTVGFRVPNSSPQARRVENRIAGSDANPYVALAVTLACGYLGMKNKIEPTAETFGAINGLDFELPRSLGEALKELDECPELHEVLGEEFVNLYIQVKDAEFEEFMKVISPWERENLLLSV